MEPSVSLWTIFRTWLALGAQSWGGGSATLMLIRREVVERRGWLSEADFTRFWAICQIAPGINLLGMTVLIGWRLGRGRGAALSLIGLLLPSVTLTAALTGAYASVRELPAVAAAMRGVVPATVGIGLLLVWQMGVPLLAEARRESGASLAVALALLAGSIGATLLWRPPVFLVLIGAGMLGGLWGWARERLRQGADGAEPQAEG